MRLLELFAGSCSVSKVFAKRGWTGMAVDIERTIDPPKGFEIWVGDVLDIEAAFLKNFDFIWASRDRKSVV